MKVRRTKRKIVAEFENGKPIALTFKDAEALRDGHTRIKYDNPRAKELMEFVKYLQDYGKNLRRLPVPANTDGMKIYTSEPQNLLYHTFSWKSKRQIISAQVPYSHIVEHILYHKALNRRLFTSKPAYYANNARNPTRKRWAEELSRIIHSERDLLLARGKLDRFIRTSGSEIKDITPEFVDRRVKYYWTKAFAFKATDEEIVEWYKHEDQDGYIACFWDQLCEKPRAPRF